MARGRVGIKYGLLTTAETHTMRAASLWKCDILRECMPETSNRFHKAVTRTQRSAVCALALVIVGIVGGLSPAFSQSTPDQQIFGPKQYLRTSGAPNEYTDTITVPTSVGAPFLLHIVNGQSNGQNRISSAWITVNNVQVAGPADFGQNVAIVDRTITLNPGTNQLKVKVASTPGAYHTIRVYGTKILPTPTALSPNPLNLTVGASGTLTATIAPAPTTAGSLTVTSSNTGVATVPSSVAFAISQTSIAIPVTAVSVGNTQITVTLNDGSVSATVDVSAAPPTIASLQPGSETITQGGTGTLTVTISAAQSTATTISLISSASSIASVPASITVPAGQTSTTISVSANTPGTAVITASLNSTSATSTITVTANLPKIVSLVPPTTSLNLGAIGTLTVTISAVQASATPIPVTVAPTGIVTVLATVTVPAGQLTTTIPVTAVALGTAMVHVSLNGTMAESAVQVTPPPPAIVSLLPSPLPVVIGANGTLTVTLNAGQLTNTEVSLTVTPSSIVQIPAIVTVPAGQTSATFTVNGLAVGTATVTATLEGTTKSATVQVQPPPPTVVSLLPNPLPLQQGATGSLTLTINAAQVSDTVIPFTNSASTIVQVPASITVPANQLSVVIPVTALLAGSATITASINSSSVSAVVQVTLPPPVVASLTTIPPDPPGSVLTRPKGKPGTLRVTLSRAPSDVTLVTLDSSATNVALVPTSVTVAAGALTADVPVNTVGEGTATITASLNGGSATATVTVTPAELVLLTLSPQELTLFVGETQPMTATATLTDGTTQNLTTDSRLVWASTNQTVATIASDGLVTALAVGASTIRATFTPTTGTPTVVETSLTVLTPPALTLTATPTTIQVGQALSVTVTSARVAGFGGLPVTITSSGTGAVSHASTVTIAENQTSTTFVVTGVTAGSVTLTATAPIRTAGTLGLTVSLPPPTITGFTPTSGTVGTVVTITGTNFGTIAQGGTIVKFNGTTAVATAVTATSLTTTVPLGSTTGPISVQTSGGTATSTTSFTVTLSVDFTISGAPATSTAVQGKSSTALIQMTSAGGLANLVNLAATGLPAGVTATFSAPVVTLFQPVTVFLTTSAATPVGTIPVTITGTTTIDSKPVARSTIVNLSVIASGTTTVSGRVLRSQDDVPLQGVTLRIGSQSTQTDASGRFLLTNAPAGTQIMMVDGTTITNPTGTYHTLPAEVTLAANQANELSWTIYLPQIDTTVSSHLNPATTSVIQDPRIPGLSLTIPAGTELRSDLDNSLITDVAITPVSPSRIPLPPPGPGLHIDPGTIYMMYFFKPGGAIPTQKITQFSLPNDLASAPGRNIIFYYFDSSPTVQPGANQWKLAGTGKISPDGKLAIPDPSIGFPKFCCALIFWCNAEGATDGNTSPDNNKDADPVDLATGQFALQRPDLVLPGRVPIAIVRGYQSGRKEAQGPFGKGTFLNFERQAQSTESGLVITYAQGNGRIDLLSRQPDGSFQNTTISALRGLVLTAHSDGSKTARWNDGTVERYGTTGRLVRWEDRNGNSTTIERGANDQISRIVDASGVRTLTFLYDTNGRIQQITDPINRTVQYAYNGSGYLETVTDPAGGVTRYTYDATGNLLTLRDPRNITYVTNEYDAVGRVIRQTLADGGVYTFVYRTFGTTITETTVTDPRGNRRTSRFNAQGYTDGRADRLGQQIRTTLDGNNQVIETRDQSNRITKYTYDAAGNITSKIDPQGHSTLYEYEPIFNQLITVTDALNQTTRFDYDTRGNLVTIIDPLNHSTTISYDEFGQPINVRDALNNVFRFEYDEVGNLVATIDPLGNKTQRSFDGVSRLARLTDPKGKTTVFQYDNLNRVTSAIDPLSGHTSFTYDSNGNLLTVADAKNQTTTYTYDNMDRVLTRKDPLNRVETYEYDADGNLIQMTDRKQQVRQLTYDARNRRIGTVYQDGSTTVTYDTLGRLARVTDTASGTVEYTYDVLDRVIQETTPQGIINFQYDALGRRTQMTANESTPMLYHYDAMSRLTRVEQGFNSVALGYDNANRRTSLTMSNGTTTSYGYDAANRLIHITHNGPAGLIESLTYGYDASNNRISTLRSDGAASALPTSTPPATYDAANEQTQFAGTSLTYDQNGNLLSDGVNTYQWDARNRLISISGAVTANFSYDPYGRRTSKTLNGQTSQYLYDGLDIVQAMKSGTVGETYLRSLEIDEVFVRQEATAEFYHVDGLGSTLSLTNAAGVATVAYTYDPFGKTTSTGTSSNAFLYTGREQDAPGIYYYRARYYSPERQRFLSEDPIQFNSGEINLYAYGRNNPVNRRDPLGLWTTPCHEEITKDAAKNCGLSDNGQNALAQAVGNVDYYEGTKIPYAYPLVSADRNG